MAVRGGFSPSPGLMCEIVNLVREIQGISESSSCGNYDLLF